MSLKLRTMVAIAIVLAPLVSVAVAQDDRESFLKPVEQHIQTVEQEEIPQWLASAQKYTVISSCVFILGLVTAALQIRVRSWTKASVAIVVLLVSGGTRWHNKGFPADVRSFLHSILKTQHLMRNLKYMIE